MELEEARALLADLWDADAEVWQTRWAPVFRSFAEEVVRRADLKPGERVLDVGTGTGTALSIAAPLIGFDGHAVGIDRSPAMAARAKAAISAGGPSVRVLEMDAAALDFPDAWFDAALSSCGVPFLRVGDVLSEVHRVLKPGGRFVWADWHLDKVAALRILDDIVARHKTAAPGPRLKRLREALSVWAAASDSLRERPDFEAALRAAGFARVHGDTVTHTLHAFTLDSLIDARLARAFARLEVDEMAPPAREALRHDAREALGHLVHGGQFEVLWPMFYLEARKA